MRTFYEWAEGAKVTDDQVGVLLTRFRAEPAIISTKEDLIDYLRFKGVETDAAEIAWQRYVRWRKV